jgi:hypothetical protein
MKSHVLRAVALATLAIGVNGAAVAQNPAGCRSVVFSEEVLTRFPKAPQACLDVIHRDGQDYAVFKAQLDSVSGNTMRVRIKKPDGTYAAATSIKTSPGRRILIDGKPVPVADLAPDQEITAYVRVDKPMIALPPVTESEPLEAVPMAAAEPVVARAEPAMPHTASQLGLLALFGVFLWSLALALRLARRKNDL